MKRFSLLYLSLMLLMLAFQSYAKIDPKALAGLWLFDEETGDNAKDSSGSGNHGKLVNVKWDKNGKYGGALAFTGSNNWVEIPANPSLGEEKFKVDKGQKLVPGNQPLRIGHRNGSTHYYNGLMDEVAVFNRALQPEELKSVMQGLESLLAVQPGGKLTTLWGGLKEER